MRRHSTSHACRAGLFLIAVPVTAQRTLSPEKQVVHVLSRLTFGARPGDLERVTAMGVDAWIARQLNPATIPDRDVMYALSSLTPWNGPARDAGTVYAAVGPMLGAAPIPAPGTVAGVTLAATPRGRPSRFAESPSSSPHGIVRSDTVGGGMFTADPMVAQRPGRMSRLAPEEQFKAGKVIYAQATERQLLEVITDFWENHFSVNAGKMPSRDALAVLDRDAIRPYALGKFRDLLGAVAKSPAMLYYLDNYVSARGGINENYARELLELHTLGVDGGYTQQDVIDVARALTGWTITPGPQAAVAGDNTPNQFVFRRVMHDDGPKIVLGHALEAGRGIEDGEQVLDIIARHPSTAHFIALKLARRLVSDDPPEALVERAAATFLRTDGDIAEVVRTLVTSDEFFSDEAFRAKVKTPFEFVVSLRRALDAPTDTTATMLRLLSDMGQPVFGHGTPEGWPDVGAAWINSGTMLQRVLLASDIMTGRVDQIPLGDWPEWGRLSNKPVETQASAVAHFVLGGTVLPSTFAALLEVPGTGAERLRGMLATAIASPDFQRR